ncbi:signal transduction response regulator [Buttiauxella ferragutiae ATCC 51602]|uniref:Signal transduction response regulator n=1 Tax=Buttiauxella ferragutiae ATCC 51602 TaxID=1354252 RepID=A0ABX2WER2_9ENTR|nr:LuxR C-terminal-related transcriptional regulator [Buttiauxella ferragutiae]OAT33516.1 signal transduction response regulator [Buttiauxella ferragutiae ATCC 51602]
MTRTLKILIVDTDQFFSAGLQLKVEMYFQARNIPVMFMCQPLSYPMADLIFWAPGTPTTMMPKGLLTKRKVILLLSKHIPHLAANYGISVFYRHQRFSHLSSLLDLAIKIDSESPAEIRSEDKGSLSLLTPRQREVMGYVSEGLTLREISAHLHINPRTVSQHKIGAMRKLQLNRTADLHNWLLCNALLEKPF